MREPLRVLMMGGQRVGKSTALAAIIDAFAKSPISEILKAKDTTVLDTESKDKQEPISKKLTEIKSTIQKHNGNTILVNSGKTSKIWHYRLSLSVPDNSSKMEIVFTDVNGEFYDSGGIQQQKINELVSNYDVFVIAIDTPSMMSYEEKDDYNWIVNEKFNFVEDIHSFLANINEKNCDTPKLVIFTPIKCEKWVQQGEVDKVVQRVKEVFDTSITSLKFYQNIRIEFLPIQTVGSMVFDEHLPAQLISYTKKYYDIFKKHITEKCSPISADRVRLSNGSEMSVSDGTIQDDLDAVLIYGSDIIRPNSWYKVVSSEYSPKNCEQLALHILDFMLKKTIDCELRQMQTHSISSIRNSDLSSAISKVADNIKVFARKTQKGFSNMANVLANYILSNDSFHWYFGDIPVKTMMTIVDTLKSKGIIKYTGEGIEVYKDIKLLTD